MIASELAYFPCSYSTAENMLTRAQITGNDNVVITGASGGVGSAAAQLSRVRGARVIAVAGASKTSSLMDLGADKCVSRGTSLIDDLGESSIDVVLDLVGGESWRELPSIWRPFGRLAVWPLCGFCRYCRPHV